jgi:hypothetical protein
MQLDAALNGVHQQTPLSRRTAVSGGGKTTHVQFNSNYQHQVQRGAANLAALLTK